jgi:hypothetical protein
MGHLVLWALSTGFVTGAVWVGIVVLRRPRPALDRDAEALGHARHRLDQVQERVAQMEERLDHAERMLTQRQRPDSPSPGVRSDA